MLLSYQTSISEIQSGIFAKGTAFGLLSIASWDVFSPSLVPRYLMISSLLGVIDIVVIQGRVLPNFSPNVMFSHH